ncbi:MAG: hypothetical protein GY768_16500, partial [Planctomycetaceae bacterium]|nr:hypothetical protein [Planctomycetaceae bacterium]
WDTGDMDDFPTNHPMWTAEAFIIHPAVVKVSRNVFQKKFKQLMKVNRKMVDFAIEQMAQSRRAAQLIPLALTLPEEERSSAVRRSADELPVTNYRLDGSKEGSFYDIGMDLPSAMRCIHDTHQWDPEYDLAWTITEAGNDVEGASGRPTADTLNDVEPLTLQPREDLYDPRFWVFSDHVDRRKHEIVDGKKCFTLSLRMFDPQNEEHWRPAGQGKIDKLDRLPKAWEPISKAMTNTLRWFGCKWKQKHGWQRGQQAS